MGRRRVRVLYSGRVQGVGFRYTVKTLSTGYEVIGTVRNLAVGRVELVAEGGRGELEDFLAAVKDSGLRRFIGSVELNWEEPDGKFRGFEIVA
jgi:acylphosphatase